MAFDKVIDSALLDAGMTATANAIRKKTGGTTPIAWDSANGFKDAVEEIETGVELPELTNPAAPTDIVAGKVLYDDSGNPVTGKLYEVLADANIMAPFETLYGNPGDTVFSVGAVFQKNVAYGYGVIIRKGAILIPRNIPVDLFGTASPSDVAKGKTFTSAAGLLVEGTLEAGGVTMSVDGETLVITGAVTIENETLIL